MQSIRLLSSVALIVDLPEHSLTRGQIGTVVEHLEHDGETAFLVEFSDADGRTYAMIPVQPDHLIPLHRKTEAA